MKDQDENVVAVVGWGGREYREWEWVRDRLGRWVKFIGLRLSDMWKTNPDTGREEPGFAHGNAFTSNISRDPKYKQRVASGMLDDGTVVLEVGNRIGDLGRVETPTEDQYGSLSTELPDNLAPGETAFVRRNPDTIEVETDPGAKKGGRAALTPEERAGRAHIEQRERAALQPLVEEGTVPPPPTGTTPGGADWNELARAGDMLEQITADPDLWGNSMVTDDDIAVAQGIQGEIDKILLGRRAPETEHAALGEAAGLLNAIADRVPDDDFVGNTLREAADSIDTVRAAMPQPAQEPVTPAAPEFVQVPGGSWDQLAPPGSYDGWTAVPGDDHMMISDDGRWVLDKDPQTAGASGIRLFDIETEESYTLPGDDPAFMDQVRQITSGATAPEPVVEPAPIVEPDFGELPADLLATNPDLWESITVAEENFRSALGQGIPEYIISENLESQLEYIEGLFGELDIWGTPPREGPLRDALAAEIRFLAAKGYSDALQENPTSGMGVHRARLDELLRVADSVDGTVSTLEERRAATDWSHDQVSQFADQFNSNETLRNDTEMNMILYDIAAGFASGNYDLADKAAEDFGRRSQELVGAQPPGFNEAGEIILPDEFEEGPVLPVDVLLRDEQLAFPDTPAVPGESPETLRTMFPDTDSPTARPLVQAIDFLEEALAAGQDGRTERQRIKEVAQSTAAQAFLDNVGSQGDIDNNWRRFKAYHDIGSLAVGGAEYDEKVNAVGATDEFVKMDHHYADQMWTQYTDAYNRGLLPDTPEVREFEDHIAQYLAALENGDFHNVNRLRDEMYPVVDELVDVDNSGAAADWLNHIHRQGTVPAGVEEASDEDYLNDLEAAVAEAGPNGQLPGVQHAMGMVDTVTTDDGSISPTANSHELGDTAVALDDAAIEVISDGDGSPEAENLVGALEDTADTMDAAAEAVAAQEVASGTGPPRVPLTRDGNRASLTSIAGGTLVDLTRMSDASDGSSRRYIRAMTDFDMAVSLGDEETAARALRDAQQALSDLSAQYMDSFEATGNLQHRISANKLRARSRAIGSALRKAGYPRTKIDRRQQPRAVRRREANAATRAERAALAAERRAERRRIRQNGGGTPTTTQPVRSVQEGQAAPTSSTNQPTRETTVEAVTNSSLSPQTATRAETALSGADLAESVENDPATIHELGNLRTGEPVDQTVIDAVAQANTAQDVTPPATPPSTTEGEAAAAQGRAAASETISEVPLQQQLDDLLALIDGSNLVREMTRTYLDDPRGSAEHPKPSRRELFATMTDNLSTSQRRTIGNVLLFVDRHFMKEALENPNPESKAHYSMLADRSGVLLESFLKEYNIELNDYTTGQHQEEMRAARAARAMATTEPDPESWFYMDDYDGAADYSPHAAAMQDVLDRILGGDVTPDRFATDRTQQALLDQARHDLARLLDGTHPLTGPDNQREVILERIINKLNRVAGTRHRPDLEEARDALLAIRAQAHGIDLAGKEWDVSDDRILGVRDALIQFIGTGTDNGRALIGAKKALDDALKAETVEGRWAGLMRARNQVELVHGEPLVPLMHALHIRVDPDRLRGLDDPTFKLARDNRPPARHSPRGMAWTPDALAELSTMAQGLRGRAEGADAVEPDLMRKTAKTIDRAVAAYNAGRYGEFELFSSIALSRLMQVGDPELVNAFAAARDRHWGGEDWAGRIGGLRDQIVEYAGRLPTSQHIDPRDGARVLQHHQLQNANAAIVEALSRPDGSTQQRALLDRALWELRQAGDPRTRWLQQLLLPWDPNGDVREMAPAAGDGNDGGTAIPETGAADARIARVQQVWRMYRGDGMVTPDRVADEFGISLTEVEALMQPAVDARIFQLWNGAYHMGTAAHWSGWPHNDATIDQRILDAYAPTPEPSPPTVREDPSTHNFLDPRITAVDGNRIAVYGPDGQPVVEAAWDPARNLWVATHGDTTHYMPDLETVDATLSSIATRNNVPFPEQAAAEAVTPTPTGETVTQEGEAPEPEPVLNETAAAAKATSRNVLSTLGDTATSDLLNDAATALNDGRVTEGRNLLDRASISLLSNASVIVPEYGGDTSGYDGDRNIDVGTAYADIREQIAALPAGVDTTAIMEGLTNARDVAPSEYHTQIDGLIDLVGRGELAEASDRLRGVIDGSAPMEVRNRAQGLLNLIQSASQAGTSTAATQAAASAQATLSHAIGEADATGITPEQQGLLQRAHALLGAGDPSGALMTARQATLDMFEQPGGSVHVNVQRAINDMYSAVATSRVGNSWNTNAIWRTPAGVNDPTLNAEMQRLTATYAHDLDQRYQAMNQLYSLTQGAVMNPALTPQQRREYMESLTYLTQVMDKVGQQLAQANAYRNDSGELVRRPLQGTPGTVSANGVGLVPGDVVRLHGHDAVFQGAALNEASGLNVASLVRLTDGSTLTYNGSPSGQIALGGHIISHSPQAAIPARHWDPATLHRTPTPERLDALRARYGDIEGQAIFDVGSQLPSIDALFDSSAPLAVREQAALDMILNPMFGDVPGYADKVTVDLSTPNRVRFEGTLPTTAGADETFSMEVSRASDTLPPVMSIQFSDQTPSAQRERRQATFLRASERWGVANGVSSIQLPLPSKSVRLTAADTGYDWDDIGMGGIDEVKKTVRKILVKAGTLAGEDTETLARLGQMMEDLNASTGMEGIPSPFQIANVNVMNPDIGRKAIASRPWVGVRHLNGPASAVDRTAQIDEQMNGAVDSAEAAAYGVWGEDRIPALLHAKKNLPTPEVISRGDGAAAFSAIMNTANTELAEGQPALFLRVRNGSMSSGGHGSVSFDVVEMVDKTTKRQYRKVGDSNLTIDHDGILKVLTTIVNHQKTHNQELPPISSIPTGQFKKSDGTHVTGQDLIDAFGDTKTLRKHISKLRQGWNREAMAALHDVGGTQMTHPQMLLARDALWRGENSGTGDLVDALRGAGIDNAIVEQIVSRHSENPGGFVRALDQRIDTLRENLPTVGPGGDFSFNGRSMYAGYMAINPHSQGGGVASLLQSRFADWAIAHDVFDYITVQANIDVGNYAWALAGFHFKETGESRRYEANRMIGHLLNSAYKRNPDGSRSNELIIPQWELDEINAMAARVASANPNSDDFPTPFEIATIGMIKTLMEGRSNWIGKTGLIGHGKSWNGKLKLKPDKLYHLAHNFELTRKEMRRRALANQSNGGVPASSAVAPGAAPQAPATPEPAGPSSSPLPAPVGGGPVA